MLNDFGNTVINIISWDSINNFNFNYYGKS